MNLRRLLTFATIADLGSYARAAVRLHLSQPALSRQIHALEEELGVPLFDRIGRRVHLTSEGEDLLRRSRRLLAEADSLGERARSLKAGKAGILRIGATPQVIESLLAAFLSGHRRRHPGIEVHLVEDGGSRMAERLARGDVHLACMPAGDPRFHARLLAPMHLLAAVPQGHRLARRAALEIAELAEEPLLVLRREFGSREWFDAACQVARIRPRVLLESTAAQTLVALASKGHGIAVLPSNVTMARGAVRTVPLLHRGASLGRWQVVAWDPQRFLAPYAEQFADELVASVQRAFPGQNLIRRAPPLPKPKESS
jgi:LysR family transcriptional regulator, cyn operon transcriptional activator